MDLVAQTLNAEAFAPYGEVFELEHARQMSINQGLTIRYHDLFRVDAATADGHPAVNVFRTRPLPLPHRVSVMERHPLGSQAFIPMHGAPFPVLVGKPADTLHAGDLALFITNGRQGINLRRNTWHHFQIVLDHIQDFLVVDRIGPGVNMEETDVAGEAWIRADSFPGPARTGAAPA